MNNIFMIVGRLFKDVEIRTTKNDKKILDLPVAINNGKDDTTYITIQLFGNLAETVSKYCKKGDLVGVRGMIKNNNYEDKEGKKHYDYQFIGDKITFLSSVKKKDEDVVDVPKNSKSEYDDQKSDIKIEDSDLPF